MNTRTAPVGQPELAHRPGRAFGIYIHVPFCATRCGYCDFNTYTPAELGGANPDGWLAALRVELALAAERVGSVPVQTVFVGGGTPSLLGGAGLAAVLGAVRDNFSLAPDAEVTTEANPESTSPEMFATLREAGYTRISLGMQSAAPQVLAVLDRTHSPGRAPAAALEAKAAGFEHVNIDLIYGTPGETDDDLRRSIDVAVESGVDHVSAYSLIVEDGTALARRVRRGEIARPDDDVLAQRYELLDTRLSAAGLHWYEVSNWSADGGECRHNLGYWRGGEWWGAGPGAHGFLGCTRWWNAKHPNAYAQALAENRLPIADFETLDANDRHVEDVMLRVRVREGLPVALLDTGELSRAETLCAEGLLVRRQDALVLTDRGRLLADGVVRDLLG
ncbi:radical SAM family heme chaperone HemW [Mycolicibacterium fortuitum]|uniref:Heme chaperone HemW n=1 Tax=Mycolicibacterium fortuitum subsp. fortuitum DSM 46621 = ATCC 6841 = JCM 6387 TaxID=1214102 RepID=K0VXY2_MYCFO|nr:radical SAM family heme chaperone HemW [Mycolicibacterium fortuitum]AIY47338.1 putative radical SAM family enzyme in heat shock gene cluster, similarity with CPO of BS HemN-type [Mycobacterium sp. VKM Ac-1817D]CRL77848.1 coproporphyrinogen III oxidase [Mycolicibacter nonchromogenicus]EJZ16324.1 coproporphyrinogen III oxidase [Mycolicibacterium fortuitum subsp. fortuitum DSM 46621 = ATCC 6841 = JCM 6387]OBG45914.1 coproporphyrinogen III oxidase [Mycolicibacterium fortuitum]WEV30858.1 radical